MDLSVIIVNYNVQYFLQQCLISVFGAGKGIAMEVWVVDNGSVDGSVEMVRRQFPRVHLIANHDNLGFARANNQALRQASGDYMLLLNPDTLVEKDTFRRCLDFMHSHADCGGLGVKMVNGKGKFLKESKRGFPSPEASFFKISGLIRLFPHNRRIAAYYMGHLPDDETNEIEILPGAFLMISRTAYDKVGGLDETFFMYGEDIDFSWRIKQAGFKNYYLPSARIIHYKGESTKKGSLNYVYTFYNAMAIFANKYFSGGGATFYNVLIRYAIWCRASLSFLRRILRDIMVPLLDFLAAWGGFALIKQLWAISNYSVNYYPASYTLVVLPAYVLAMMSVGWLAGGYEKPVHLGRIARGMALGAFALLAFYSLVDEGLRYSRAILVLGAVWSIVAVLLLRLLYGMLNMQGYVFLPRHRNLLIVGGKQETERVEHLLSDVGITSNIVAKVALDDNQDYTSSIGCLKDLIHYYKINEVIFCIKDLSIHDIISQMTKLQTTGVEYKVAPGDGDYIIGSESINSSEDLYTVQIYSIAESLPRRNKRLLDIASALLLLLLSPLLFWLQRHKDDYFRHCWQVLTGRRSWVGYCPDDPSLSDLPAIKPGIFSPADLAPHTARLNHHRLNLCYAKNYKLTTDLSILLRKCRDL